jgi:hypothetical protein
MSEREMYSPLESFFRKKGFQTFREVPLLTRRIDLVCINRGSVVAVELKVKNWQKALQQALSYRLCANRVYLAVAKQFVHRVDCSMCEDFGIGVLGVDGNVNVVLEAMLSPIIHASLLRRILEYVDHAGRRKLR